MFPRLRIQATYLEDAEFAPPKQKCFASFPFTHPCNIVSNIDSKCLCSNASSFASTFRNIKVVYLMFTWLTLQLLREYMLYSENRSVSAENNQLFKLLPNSQS